MTGEPHVAIYLGVSQLWVYRSGTEAEPAAEFCSSAAVSISNGELVCVDDGAAERFPFRYIDDDVMLIGSQVTATDLVYECVLGAALAGVGVGRYTIANVVEVGFPTHWGSHRRSKIRDALRHVAREVVFVTGAVGAALALGERASGTSVVVELSGLAASIVQVDRSESSARLGPCVLFPDRGSRDVMSAPARVGELMDRAHALGASARGDVVVLTTTTPQVHEISHSASATHHISGPDIVRGLATSSPPVTLALLPQPEERTAGAPTSVRNRMPARSAHWLNAAVPVDSRRRVGVLPGAAVAHIAKVGAVVAVVAVAAIGIGVVVWRDESPPVSIAQPPVTEPPVTLSSAPDTSATTEAAPSSVETPFERGRVSLRLPDGWRLRSNPDRFEFEPVLGGQMRIVVVSTALSDGTDLEQVADALARTVANRSRDGVLGNFERSVDVGTRRGLSYTETPPGGSTVTWKVFVDDGLQVSVGCQFAPGYAVEIEDACASAVNSVTVAAP